MFMSNHEGDVRYGSSGKLLSGYEARLLDQEGNPTPDGEVGNLWVKGESAAMGYWQKPEVTATHFCRRLGAHRRSLRPGSRRLLVSHGSQRRLFQIKRPMGVAGGG